MRRDHSGASGSSFAGWSFNAYSGGTIDPALVPGSNSNVTNDWDDDSITAGDTLDLQESSTDEFASGDTVRLIWKAGTGDSATLAEGTVQ